MKMLIYPHHVAEAYKPAEGLKTAMIRILEPDGGNGELKYESEFEYVLSLYFHDLTIEMVRQVENPEKYKLISEDDSKAIVQFFEKFQDIDVIIIHCYAGINRSPAIALAFASYIQDECMATEIATKYYTYNQEVYESVMKQLPKTEQTLHLISDVVVIIESWSDNDEKLIGLDAKFDWGTRMVFRIREAQVDHTRLDWSRLEGNIDLIMDKLQSAGSIAHVLLPGGNKCVIANRQGQLYASTECDDCNVDIPAGKTIFKNESKYLYCSACAEANHAKAIAIL
jgi:predicted protein tyrosine phosphatase